MAKKLDFRKKLREIAIKIQDENAERLLAGISVRGDGLKPLETEHAEVKSRKRVRVFGVRVALREIHRLGIKTGAMLKDLTRRANIKIGRTSFKIIPSAGELLKWRVFNSGRTSSGIGGGDQSERRVGGITGTRLDAAGRDLAIEARDQTVAQMQDGVDGR